MLAVCCVQTAQAFCPSGTALPLSQRPARAMLRPSMALQAAPSVGLAAKGAVALPVAAAQASILVLPEIFSPRSASFHFPAGCLLRATCGVRRPFQSLGGPRVRLD